MNHLPTLILNRNKAIIVETLYLLRNEQVLLLHCDTLTVPIIINKTIASNQIKF